MIERLKTLQAKQLSTYHQGIVDDFLRAVQKWGRLTSRQESFLQNIEEQYTAEATSRREQALHRLQADEQYRNDVRVVCEYYRQTGYYSGAYTKALHFLSSGDTKDAPEPRSLDKMMNNKYAQNILATVNSEPKFVVGDLVQLRASAGGYDNIKGNRTALRAKAFMVVEVDSSPVSRPLTYCPTKGGTRWYKLLAMGTTDTVEVIERELKRPTKKALGK